MGLTCWQTSPTRQPTNASRSSGWIYVQRVKGVARELRNCGTVVSDDACGCMRMHLGRHAVDLTISELASLTDGQRNLAVDRVKQQHAGGGRQQKAGEPTLEQAVAEGLQKKADLVQHMQELWSSPAQQQAEQQPLGI